MKYIIHTNQKKTLNRDSTFIFCNIIIKISRVQLIGTFRIFVSGMFDRNNTYRRDTTVFLILFKLVILLSIWLFTLLSSFSIWSSRSFEISSSYGSHFNSETKILAFCHSNLNIKVFFYYLLIFFVYIMAFKVVTILFKRPFKNLP